MQNSFWFLFNSYQDIDCLALPSKSVWTQTIEVQEHTVEHKQAQQT